MHDADMCQHHLGLSLLAGHPANMAKPKLSLMQKKLATCCALSLCIKLANGCHHDTSETMLCTHHVQLPTQGCTNTLPSLPLTEQLEPIKWDNLEIGLLMWFMQCLIGEEWPYGVKMDWAGFVKMQGSRCFGHVQSCCVIICKGSFLSLLLAAPQRKRCSRQALVSHRLCFSWTPCSRLISGRPLQICIYYGRHICFSCLCASCLKLWHSVTNANNIPQ